MVKSPFEFIRDIQGWKGVVKFYKDTRDDSYVLVSRADTFDRGDETMAFPADKDGDVLDWEELGAGYGITHEELLAQMA